MADHAIPQEGPAGKDWEEKLYQEGCALLKEEATRLLKERGAVLPYSPPKSVKRLSALATPNPIV